MADLVGPLPEWAAGWELTLDTALRIACHLHKERIALTSGDRHITYGELAAATAELARRYRALGVDPGDRVLCRLPNRPELLLSAAAAWRCGAIHTAADRDLTVSELAALAAQLEPRLVVVERAGDASTAAAAEALRHASPGTRILTCEDIDWPSRADTDLAEGARVASPLDAAIILSTSGTSGAPKHVLREHGELALRWWAWAGRMEAAPGEAHLAQLPLSHGFGLGMAVGALLTGGRLVFMERFSADEAVGLIERERIALLNGAPPHFDLILRRVEDPGGPAADVSSLRAGCGSGAIFPTPLVRRILDTLSLRFWLAYGCSEGLGWSTSETEDLRLGSVGRPPGEHLRIVDPEDHRPVPPGTMGEIAIRRHRPRRLWRDGDQPGAGDATRSTTAGPRVALGDDAWYLSGDLGRLDADGRLYVLGRIGTQICRGGVWVQPEEVEAALSGHPLLRDVGVIGLPDPLLGERVCACIVPSGASPTLEALRRSLGERLARFKHPEALLEVDEIPRSQVGKIDRTALRQRIGATTTPQASA